MKVKMFQVDAFTDKLFGGNPAAVCVLDSWLDDKSMQAIAGENNLAETAFIVKNSSGYDIRWFTPAVEVELCGHATLASAHVIFDHLGFSGEEIIFHSPRSGMLKVRRYGTLLTLDFPTDHFVRALPPTALTSGIGMLPLETWKGKTDYLAVLPSEEDVAGLEPYYAILATLTCRGVIVTARGNEVDFVSRFFAPQSGINEDPVTGSAHTTLAPYWAKVLGKNEMTAIQLSARKGHLTCKYLGDRVEISGNAVTYMSAEIEVG